MADLTAKQEAFCREYLVDFNATQAALRAGYAKKSARQQAADLLSKPNIAARLQVLMEERNKRVDVDADWVLRRLVMIASADLRTILDEQGNVLPPDMWPDEVAAAVEGIEVSEIGHEGQSIGLVKKIRRASVLKALELAGRHTDVQAFKDQVEHSGQVVVDTADRILQARKRAGKASE